LAVTVFVRCDGDSDEDEDDEVVVADAERTDVVD
jgi:hypothetical protein